MSDENNSWHALNLRSAHESSRHAILGAELRNLEAKLNLNGGEAGDNTRGGLGAFHSRNLETNLNLNGYGAADNTGGGLGAFHSRNLETKLNLNGYGAADNTGGRLGAFHNTGVGRTSDAEMVIAVVSRRVLAGMERTRNRADVGGAVRGGGNPNLALRRYCH